jgi:superfamily II DNA helicase RecQ
LQNTKIFCLEACRDGFSVSAFLEARSKAAIEKPATVKTKQTDMVTYENSHPALFQELKRWRSRMASHLDRPEYMILHNKTIMEISTRLPSSLNELKAIKGMGRRKLNEFGSQILEIINSYCKDTSISYNNRKEQFDAQQNVKQNTRQITFDLVKSEKSL